MTRWSSSNAVAIGNTGGMPAGAGRFDTALGEELL